MCTEYCLSHIFTYFNTQLVEFYYFTSPSPCSHPYCYLSARKGPILARKLTNRIATAIFSQCTVEVSLSVQMVTSKPNANYLLRRLLYAKIYRRPTQTSKEDMNEFFVKYFLNYNIFLSQNQKVSLLWCQVSGVISRL